MSMFNRREFLEAAALSLCSITTSKARAKQLIGHTPGPDDLAHLFERAIPAVGSSIAAKHTFELNTPPEHVPTVAVVDGPLLGNGDLGLTMGGDPHAQQFYIGKNDFWSYRMCPLSVGSISLSIPDLIGASYKQEEDISNAEVRSTFEIGDFSLYVRTWICATTNLIVVEFTPKGRAAAEVHAQILPKPTTLVDNSKSVNLGREQHEGGRWYFNGLLAGLHLYDRALTIPELNQLKDGVEIDKGLVRRWSFDAREGQTPVDTPTKMMRGPSCTGDIPILRPEEWPTNLPSGCNPIGSISLDYQGYSLAPQGRAVKLMHSWDYIDAGTVPPLTAVSIVAWIYIFSAGDENFILSKGSWDEAYSFQLDEGRLRFNIGDRFVRSRDALPYHQWIHVAGTFDGRDIRIFIGGEEVLPRARFIRGGIDADTVWLTRNADGPLDDQYPWPNPLPPVSTLNTLGREVAIAMRVLGADSEITNDGIHFTVRTEQKSYLAVAVVSDLDSPNYLEAAKNAVKRSTLSDIDKLNVSHRDWWHSFWAESYVEISDPLIEKFYYASQYILGSSSRTGKVAPGLYGPWITTDHSSWNGDYTLDYNYETPYFGLYSSNHLSVAGSYELPLLAFMDRGEMYARTLLGVRGVYYPAHIGPWGMDRPRDNDPFMGIRGNAAFAAQPILMRFYSTYDESYAGMVYPFIRKVGEFWEDYLTIEDGRYVINNDCFTEVGPWRTSPKWASCGVGDRNTMSDLAFVRTVFSALLAMSSMLGVDGECHSKWRNILDHLSSFPIGENNGKRVLLAAENSPTSELSGWGTLAIWPAGQIGLSSAPSLLEAARNTVANWKWATHPLFAPALARIGDNPIDIFDKLYSLCKYHAYPNGYIYFGGGGIESASTIPSTINEMLLQSYDGVLRLFPVWAKEKNARFCKLRGYGAFLVSSELVDGQIKWLMIESEKGRDCVLENPWPDRHISLWRNGLKAEVLSGNRISIKTGVREQIAILPS